MNPAFETRYHELESDHWWFRARRAFVRGWLDRLKLSPVSQLLDLGCASGTLLCELRQSGWTELSGLDVSLRAVERCHTQGLTGVCLGDAAHPHFAAESFDVLVASDVLEHLADDQGAVNRWREIVRPGGWGIICVPAYEWLWSRHDVVNHHYRRYTRRQLAHLLREAGWVVRHAGYWNGLLLPAVAAVRAGQRLLGGPVRPPLPAFVGTGPVSGLSTEANWPAPPAETVRPHDSATHSSISNTPMTDDVDPHQLRRSSNWMNHLLCGLLGLENRWILSGCVLPAGISTYVIVQRP